MEIFQFWWWMKIWRGWNMMIWFREKEVWLWGYCRRLKKKYNEKLLSWSCNLERKMKVIDGELKSGWWILVKLRENLMRDSSDCSWWVFYNLFSSDFSGGKSMNSPLPSFCNLLLYPFLLWILSWLEVFCFCWEVRKLVTVG